LLLTRFFDAISKHLPGDPFMGGNPAEVAKLNPGKFYVENVRKAMRVSTRQAQLYCDTAVRQGIFDRYVEVLCPDEVVATSARTESELPETVHCWMERAGELEDVILPTASLTKRTFYRLHK
jgi:hypothetical protein